MGTSWSFDKSLTRKAWQVGQGGMHLGSLAALLLSVS